MLEVLKRRLRKKGWTGRRLADELDVGEATIKRWLIGRGLTLENLAALAMLVDWSVADLARESEDLNLNLRDTLTLAQERALSSDSLLSLLFITLLGGLSPAEVQKDFQISEQRMEDALEKLARLALIDILPGRRVKPLVERTIVWDKSPMRERFEATMKGHFMAMDYTSSETDYASEVIKLSDKGRATLAELIEQHRRDVQALSEQDRAETNLPRKWYAMLCVAGDLDPDLVARSI